MLLWCKLLIFVSLSLTLVDFALTEVFCLYSLLFRCYSESKFSLFCINCGLFFTWSLSNVVDSFVTDAGIGVVDVVVVDPRGDKNSVRPFVAKVIDDQWYVEYVPQVDGHHSVEIFFAGSHIPNSPVAVFVMPRELQWFSNFCLNRKHFLQSCSAIIRVCCNIIRCTEFVFDCVSCVFLGNHVFVVFRLKLLTPANASPQVEASSRLA